MCSATLLAAYVYARIISRSEVQPSSIHSPFPVVHMLDIVNRACLAGLQAATHVHPITHSIQTTAKVFV